MKSYPTQFTRFPCYEDLRIIHFFDTIHIGNNVTKTLWWIIDSRRDKETIVKICSDIQEVNHVMQSGIKSNRNGDWNNLPWLLIERQRNDVKDVIWRITFHVGFSSNISNILTKKVEFDGVKTHDFHNFIKVIILLYIFIYWYIYIHSFFLSTLD